MGVNNSKKQTPVKEDPVPSGSTLGPAEFQALQTHYNKINTAASDPKASISPATSTPACSFHEALLADLGLDLAHKDVVGELFGLQEDNNNLLSFETYRSTVETLLHGPSRDVRDLLFRSGKNTSFSKLFGFLVSCNRVQSFKRKNKDANGIGAHSLVLGWERFVNSRGVALDDADTSVFNDWCERQVPGLHHPLREFIREHSVEEGGSFNEDEDEDAESECSLREETVFALRCSGQVFHGEWKRLFSSASQGMSFENLCHAMVGYAGPTLLVVNDTLGNAFAAMSTTEWKEHPQFFGDGNNVLYSLWPMFSVYRARHSHQHAEDTENYQYLNAISRTKAHGIGFGGKKEMMRIWLSGDLDECKAHSFDLTYDQGPLRTVLKSSDVGEEVLEPDDFTPALIELYGFGGEKALEAQRAAREEKEEIVSSRRQVDKKQFIQSDFDKEFLFGGTFKASNEKQER